MLRAIQEIQPSYIVGENVPGLINWDGGLVFEQVQADLENEGYEVIPVILPACSVNAPHRRDRIWFVAYSNGMRRTQKYELQQPKVCEQYGEGGTTPNSESQRGGRTLTKMEDGTDLTQLAHHNLLPTPTAISDVKGGCTRKDSKRQNDTLAHAIHGQIGQTGKTSQLNPQFVSEMMGFPPDWTELPFLSGETKVLKV